jgi:hypothetical protein
VKTLLYRLAVFSADMTGILEERTQFLAEKNGPSVSNDDYLVVIRK